MTVDDDLLGDPKWEHLELSEATSVRLTWEREGVVIFDAEVEPPEDSVFEIPESVREALRSAPAGTRFSSAISVSWGDGTTTREGSPNLVIQ